jgi:ribosome-binding factor A
MKNRLARVNELIQRELGMIIQKDLEFPGVLVTINGIDITPDLRHCHIYIGVIGPEQEQEKVVTKLNDKRSALQKRLTGRVTLKQTPHLHFKLDHSVERGVRVTRIMEGIDAEIGKDAWKDLLNEDEAEDFR